MSSTKNKISKDNTNTFELKNKTDLIQVKDTNRVVFVLTLLASGMLIFSLAGLTLGISNYRLAKRQKIYVEQPDGSIEIAQEKDFDYRSDEVIKETVTNWLYLNWEWDNRIPNSEKKDSGVSLKNEANYVKVPSKVYTASYLMEDGFRQEFLKKMAQLVPESVYRGNLTSNLRIYHLGQPKRNKNQYEIQVVTTRIDLSSNGERGETKFNKIFVLETIEPYHLVLEEDEPSNFRKQLQQLLKNGLMIKEIRNFT